MCGVYPGKRGRGRGLVVFGKKGGREREGKGRTRSWVASETACSSFADRDSCSRIRSDCSRIKRACGIHERKKERFPIVRTTRTLTERTHLPLEPAPSPPSPSPPSPSSPPPHPPPSSTPPPSSPASPVPLSLPSNSARLPISLDQVRVVMRVTRRSGSGGRGVVRGGGRGGCCGLCGGLRRGTVCVKSKGDGGGEG